MNKSIYMFIGGSVFGVVAAVTLIKSTEPAPQQTAVATKPTGMKIITAKVQAEQMQSGEPMESMSDMQIRMSQQPGEQSMVAIAGDKATAATETEKVKPVENKLATQAASISKVPVIPPTEVQVKQYQDMETMIRTAANNPKVNLSELIEKADNLTIEQRDQLTKTALGMLDRGELSIEQFARK